MKKQGFLICGLSFLTLSINISIAKLSLYMNKVGADCYNPDIFSYINPYEIIFIIIALIIGCYMIFNKNKDN